MSIDRSLKIKGALSRHRNVLSRAERLEVLKEKESWDEDKSVFALPKVSHRKVGVGKKDPKILKTDEDEAVAETTTEEEPAS